MPHPKYIDDLSITKMLSSYNRFLNKLTILKHDILSNNKFILSYKSDMKELIDTLMSKITSIIDIINEDDKIQYFSLDQNTNNDVKDKKI
jgi:hypothetical protein